MGNIFRGTSSASKSEALLNEMQRVSEVPSAQRNPFDKAVHQSLAHDLPLPATPVQRAAAGRADWPAELRAFIEQPRGRTRGRGDRSSRGQEARQGGARSHHRRMSRFDRMEQLDELGKRVEDAHAALSPAGNRQRRRWLASHRRRR